MSTTVKYLSYRGEIRSIAVFQEMLYFTTVHVEGLPSALYRLDAEKIELSSMALPCGGVSLAAVGKQLVLGGDDSRIYVMGEKSKSVQPLKVELESPATAIAPLAGDAFALLAANHLVVVDSASGSVSQSIELPEKGASLTSDPTGHWLVVGGAKGQVAVYELNDQGQLQVSDSSKLHEGSVTALLFEPEELRFLSAGADQKLLLTHARGSLEPEDRGRGGHHRDVVTAMLNVPGERFVTTSRDKTCKTWARGAATRPATFDDAVPAVVAASLVEIHSRPHLVIAGADASIRFVLLDAGGRFGGMTCRIYDAYDRASQLLREGDIGQRGDALNELADYDDVRSIEMIAKQVAEDADHGLRLRGAKLLAKSRHPRAAALLEPLLKHGDEAVRLVALDGLRSLAGKESLRPLKLALDAKHTDVGTAAVKALESLAKKDDQARQLLIRALDFDPEEVRRSALLGLERVLGKDSAEPTLIGAKSRKADTRRLTLIRAFQRDQLADSRVAGTVRRSGEDADADVRHTACLVALLSRPNLAKAIRQRDKDVHRQLFELENFSLTPTDSKAKQPPKTKPTKISLEVADYQPLLSAMSSRVVDSCLWGARCLALLGDARAFGTLLQLSREEDVGARASVCRSLALLADARATQRLESMADDDAAEVRDAAYTALEDIYASDPLQSADIGLKSSHVDVRRRALKTLSSAAQKSKKRIDPRGRELMLRALNDEDPTVCGEAFKTSLGVLIDGTAEATLRFALESVRENVRREVLTEAMAQDKHEWAKELLVDLLNDPSEQIRCDAYEHLLTKSKGRDLGPMRAALESRFVDMRLRGADSLIKLKTTESVETLASAVEDSDPAVREKAIHALIHLDAVDNLQHAMTSPYTDVRLIAACNRALYHDSAARSPLLEVATSQEPEREADRSQWSKEVVVAIRGLGILGHEDFLEPLLSLLDSKQEAIRHAAAIAVTTCVRPHQAERLKQPLQHTEPEIRYRMALGLALCREPSALPVVFSDSSQETLTELELLKAAVAFGTLAEDQLIRMLDAKPSSIRNAAFLTLLFRDWRSHSETPARVLSALSAQDPRLRLSAARILERFADPVALGSEVEAIFNDRGEEPPWSVTRDQIGALADLIVFGAPHCQADATGVLNGLDAEEQTQWDFDWKVCSLRYEEQMKQAQADQSAQEIVKIESTADELNQLAFGAYVGLVREQGGYHSRGHRPSFGSTVIAIRQQAIRRLVAMAKDREDLRGAVQPVLIQALGDANQAVRSLAFDLLPDAGCLDEERAAAAVECGHTDLAVSAFKLLTRSAGKRGQKVLEDVVTTRDDVLASEAGLLLLEMTDATTAAKAALESPHAGTRALAVGWLAAAYDRESKAKRALIAAYQSRFQAVRRDVAFALALKKDKHAYEMLLEQLNEVITNHFRARVLISIQELGDPRSPEALVDALLQDEAKTLDSRLLLSTVASFRQPSSLQKLLPLLERQEWRDDVANCVLHISGHDQRIFDPRDELPNRDWMEQQYARHDEVLAKYLERCLELNLVAEIRNCLPAAQWSLSDAVDAVYPTLSSHADEELRRQAVISMGWRFKKRNGPAQGLVAALESRDTLTRFHAAVGLARGGRDDGIELLLSSVELMSDLALRRQAVEALGELGDIRALDLLLKIVNEEGHALQDRAATAIGYLGQSEQADEIFALLERLAKSDGSVSNPAIVGLRHLDTPSGWEIIRARARDEVGDQHLILRQLGYNDTPETRQLLLDMIKGYWLEAALPPAKRLFGDDSLEPDYAAVGSEEGYYAESWIEDQFHCLARVCEQGEAERIFEVLPSSMCSAELSGALLRRDPLPVEAAVSALESTRPLVIQTAASVIGRVGKKEHGKQLGVAVDTWLRRWDENRLDLIRTNDWYSGANSDLTEALCRLAWAIGRTEAGRKPLLLLLESHPAQQEFVEVRRAAALALGELKLTKTERAALEPFMRDDDASIRETVAEVLARSNKSQAADYASQMVSDRRLMQRFSKLSVDLTKVAAENAEHAHYQAIVLPELVAGKCVSDLRAAASNQDLHEATRLGAIEGLARIANGDADEVLAAIGNEKSMGEEIQKAAWRALRRSKREQVKKAV
ncbi:MAG: HEAT repeat domain-containing protein [Rubripirellula sp.]